MCQRALDLTSCASSLKQYHAAHPVKTAKAKAAAPNSAAEIYGIFGMTPVISMPASRLTPTAKKASAAAASIKSHAAKIMPPIISKSATA